MEQVMSMHFLRPEWLWAIIPVAILLWFILKNKLQQGNWHSLIDPKFQQVLLDANSQQKTSYLPVMGLAIIWLVAIIALSGPSWQQVEQPSEKMQQGTVILLDNSLSMLAEDIKPNRITRARYKLIDFLKINPHLSTGLVIYSGSAHSLSPISDDNQTMTSLLPNINPIIMPSFGSNAVLGLAKAVQLLEQSRIKNGHIIWLLDDINQDEISQLKQQLSEQNITITLLVVGTAKGAPISVPDHGLLKNEAGKIIIAKVPRKRLANLASELNAQLIYLQNDNSDIEQISKINFSDSLTDKSDKKEKAISSWLDNGIYLLLPLLLIVAFSFRRGWVVSSVLIWTMLVPPLAIFAPESFAEDEITKSKEVQEVKFLNFLKSNDQQGYEHWQKQDYNAALDKFESSTWQGASHYKIGEYAKAEKKFELDKSANGRFNQGNALAKQGKFADAQKQFEKALKLNPGFKDAEKNLNIIKKIIAKQQQKQHKPNQEGDGKNKQTDKGKQKEGEQGEQSKGEKPNSKQPNQSQESNQNNKQDDKQKKNKAEQSKQDDKKQSEEAKDEKDKTRDGESENSKNSQKENKALDKARAAQASSKDKKELTEEAQAQKAWFNQIPDDPGLFLKNKFEFQYQYQQQQQKKSDKGKIW